MFADCVSSAHLLTFIISQGVRKVYKIENMPKCSEISNSEVKRQIDLAAATWNEVGDANVLLVSIW